MATITDKIYDLVQALRRFPVITPSVQVDTTVSFANGVTVITGAGTPEAAVTAPVGSLFLRSDGGAATTLYVKQTGVGNTGWAAK